MKCKLQIILLYSMILTTIYCCKFLGLHKEINSPEITKPSVIMVVDSSFDTSLPIFQDKVIARYSIECKEKCTLKEGFRYTPKQDESILSLKDKLNNAVDQKNLSLLTSAEKSQLQEKLVFSHGTATASIIAYRNSSAKLVLVQLVEMSEGNEQDSQSEKIQCHSPIWRAKFQTATTQLISEWSTQSRELPAREVLINELALKYNVQIINKSYGPIGPPSYIRSKIGIKCPELAEYMVLLQKLDQEQIIYSGLADENLPYIILQSSGNEGTKIDTTTDDPYCGRTDDNHFLVGSFDASGGISSFSNYGDCVNFYVLGSRVIAAQPGDILFPVDGTSFSSPLGTRIAAHLTGSSKSHEFEEILNNHIDSRRFLRADLEHMRRVSYKEGENLSLTALDSFSREVLSQKKEKQFYRYIRKFMKEFNSTTE